MAPIRIALFLCDHTPPNVRESDGDYLTVFETLLRNSSPSTVFELVPFEVRTQLEYPKPEEIDTFQAILLTGSGKFSYSIQAHRELANEVMQLPRPTRMWNG